MGEKSSGSKDRPFRELARKRETGEKKGIKGSSGNLLLVRTSQRKRLKLTVGKKDLLSKRHLWETRRRSSHLTRGSRLRKRIRKKEKGNGGVGFLTAQSRKSHYGRPEHYSARGNNDRSRAQQNGEIRDQLEWSPFAPEGASGRYQGLAGSGNKGRPIGNTLRAHLLGGIAKREKELKKEKLRGTRALSSELPVSRLARRYCG